MADIYFWNRYPKKNGEGYIVFFLILEVYKSKKCIFTEKPQMKYNSLNKQKHAYLIHIWLDKALKVAVVNRALSSLHKGSLEITFTVPLRITWSVFNFGIDFFISSFM